MEGSKETLVNHQEGRMKIINTAEVDPHDLSEWERAQVYNGMDAAITVEVLHCLLPQLDGDTRRTYDFERALQGPALEMRLRGVLIDQRRKVKVIDDFREKIDRLEQNLERLTGEGLGLYGFNYRSNPDLHNLFYGTLKIPPIIRAGRPTVNRDALEKLENYTVARQFVKHLKALRDLGKKIAMLKTEIDADGRMRTSFNIAGTSTGRFSSSFSEFGTGTNFQNIEESLRSVFCADPGMKFAYIDAQQGESRVVGAIEWNLFKDGSYLDACESGDLHTAVTKLCWPALPWTGRLELDRALAEEPYYRHYTRRFMSKKIGHGSNYGGKPPTLSTQAKIEVEPIKEFQRAYFKAFPAHQEWHHYVRNRLAYDGFLISLMGRKRWFFGRRQDDATVREALAYDPQGSLADILNTGLLNVWKARDAQVLMQIHDAILIQYPQEKEDEVIPKVLKQLELVIPLNHNRIFIMPYDVATGWNWGKASEDNPDGLKTYKGGDQRKRSKKVHILDRKLR